ncbi:hypothetical protein CASFOL_018539 [Castilleja foliolosa]|uniref:Uncharacterized protein n=1 Tax=Castilleja foliolosa TaxID=1961234 RepID=A0ABD3D518_9LAMI
MIDAGVSPAKHYEWLSPQRTHPHGGSYMFRTELFGPDIRGTDCTRKKVTSQILTKSVVEKKHYSIHPEWASTKLEYLSLETNMLTGSVPAELGKLTNLVNLRLSSNTFTGKVPSFGSWTNLTMLELQASGFEGPIPSSISLLKNLTELSELTCLNWPIGFYKTDNCTKSITINPRSFVVCEQPS